MIEEFIKTDPSGFLRSSGGRENEEDNVVPPKHARSFLAHFDPSPPTAHMLARGRSA